MRNGIPHGRIHNPTYKFPTFLRRYGKNSSNQGLTTVLDNAILSLAPPPEVVELTPVSSPPHTFLNGGVTQSKPANSTPTQFSP